MENGKKEYLCVWLNLTEKGDIARAACFQICQASV